MSFKLKNNKKQEKSFFASTLVTLFIVAMLIMSGPAQAVQVAINANNLNNLVVGQTGFFYVNVTIGTNERIPIANFSVDGLPDIPGSPDGKLVFNVSDIPEAGGFKVKGNYNITLLDIYGWVGGSGGFGYDSNYADPPYYGYGYGYSFIDYGYGYGYGYGGGNASNYIRLKYKVSVNTAGALAGTYNVVSRVNTGQGVDFQGGTSFTLTPATISVTIDILKDKINPGSNEDIKVAILSTASFNASAQVNPSSVRFGPSGATQKTPYNKSEDVNSDGRLDLVIPFSTMETGINCNDTSAILIGKTYTGQNITGSDTYTTIGCDDGISRRNLTTIAVSPPSTSLTVGDTQTFTASPKDQDGAAFPATVTWTSSNTTVGTVDISGNFTALTPGTSMVNATNGSVAGTAIVTVTISHENATATREIKSKSILPGESIIITVRISGNVNALALHEIPPEGWNVTRRTDSADAFKNSTNEWAWKSMETNTTVTYTLTAPVNISIGTYQIEGTVIDVNGILANVDGDKSVKIDILEFYRRLGNDPYVVETTDLLRAFYDFINNIVPQGFNQPLSSDEVDELVNEWRNS